jgi:hypothetical protein
MFWVGVRYRGIALPDIMQVMRVWFDNRRYQPQKFDYVISGSGVLVRVQFQQEADATSMRLSAGSMTPCSGQRYARPIAAWSELRSNSSGQRRTGRSRRRLQRDAERSRAGLDRRAAGPLSGRADLYLLEIFPERLRPRRRAADRSPAAEPLPCRPPHRCRRRPRCAGPGTRERSRAGLDRDCRRKDQLTGTGAARERLRLSPMQAEHEALAAARSLWRDARCRPDRYRPYRADPTRRFDQRGGTEWPALSFACRDSRSQVDRVVAFVMRNKPSTDFCGYWQRHLGEW